MIKLKNYINLSLLYIIFVIITLDLLSKNYVINHFKLNRCYYITTFINIIYLQNYGIILGFFLKKNLKINNFAILIINIVIFILFICYVEYKDNLLSYIFIISGILSNMINRIQYGFVVDFINIHIYNFNFPIVNIADIIILIGIIIFIIQNFYEK
ncbi:signal peptidase II [Enterobacteriaceae endosymbiont of Donacia tomentosa]|uniref:signal peptidase II n=1 Tax=Enterobacteriaceae endosymbiont of Donacia tomentosa TaxID=2675787 RepID=UPI001456FFEA|nr:signal peptidase II [Enterobacteriaceae endosymbiont of Donacia tomentosa]